MKDAFMVLTILAAGLLVITGCDKEGDQETNAHQTGEHSMQSAGNESSDAMVMEMDKTDEDIVQELCPVMGGPINKDIFIEYKGKKVYFCCGGCDDMFLKEPEKYIDKLPQFKDVKNEAEKVLAAGQQTKCPVMGGDINKDIFIEYKGKKVYFCCGGCDDMFLKDPEKYIAKLPQFGGKE